MFWRAIVFIAALLIGSGIALKEQEQHGGFTDTELKRVSVLRSKLLSDDSLVILQGRILRFMGDNKYLFSDNTGTITVEIENWVWRGLSAGENDIVEISGEVDRDFLRVEIDVWNIRKL